MISCNHTWHLYEGITNRFEYCTHCDVKKGEEHTPVLITEYWNKDTGEYKVTFGKDKIVEEKSREQVLVPESWNKNTWEHIVSLRDYDEDMWNSMQRDAHEAFRDSVLSDFEKVCYSDGVGKDQILVSSVRE